MLSVFQNNSIFGTSDGVYLFGQPNNTVSNNTIIDSGVGISGVTGNTVTGKAADLGSLQPHPTGA